MAIIDDLFKQGSNYFTKGPLVNASRTVTGGTINPAVARALGLAGIAGAVIPPAVSNVKDVYKYVKSLGDYAAVAKKNQATSGKTDADIMRDFNSLYFGNNAPRTIAAKTLSRIYPQDNTIATTNKQVSRDKLNTNVPPATKDEQEAMDFANSYNPSNSQTQPQSVVTVDNGGAVSTNINTIPTQQQQGTSTGGAAGMTPEEILAYAKEMNEMRNAPLQASNKQLQAIIDNYGKLQRQSFMRDLGMAGLAGLTGNQAYAKLMGQYGKTNDALNQYKLQQELANKQAQQIFDPYPIMANMEVMKQLGLDPITAMANKDILGTYSKIKGNEIGLEGRKYSADQALAQAIMIQDYINKRADADREVDWYKAKNPQYNTLAAQVQMLSSLFGSTDPLVRQYIAAHPELIEQAALLTGIKPTGNIPVQPQAQTKPQARQGSIGKFGGR